jgi:hypothetical protein
MICYCKYSFNIGASFFLKGKEYYYDTSYHLQEFENCTIQTKIYHVYFTPDYDIRFGQSFTELKFQDRFDDRMEKREKLINQILDQPSS